jgi:DNA (cytosine-5)-methyltransferase 1
VRELHLFAGIGGGILAGEMLGHTPVCAVEVDEFRQKLLRRHWSELPIYGDIRSFDGTKWAGRVDLVSGGFPCQDISSAGKGEGLKGPRSGLWFQMLRVVCEIRPRFVFVENSPMLRTRGLGIILRGLAVNGFDAVWETFSAAEVGANHERKRMWILAANTDGERLTEQALHDLRKDRPRATNIVGAGDVADACGAGLPSPEREKLFGARGWDEGGAATERGWWRSEPDVGRVAHGVPERVDRLKSLGDSQCPLHAATAFQRLMAALTS